MKTIQKELGEDNQTVELDELKAKIADAKMSAEAEKEHCDVMRDFCAETEILVRK